MVFGRLKTPVQTIRVITLDRLVNVLGGYGVRLTHCPVHVPARLRSVAAGNQRAPSESILPAVGAAGSSRLWAGHVRRRPLPSVRADRPRRRSTEPPVLIRSAGIELGAAGRGGCRLVRQNPIRPG